MGRIQLAIMLHWQDESTLGYSQTIYGQRQLGPVIFHFENIAEVNKWTVAGKLQWLKVRLAGCAQAVLQWFGAEDAADYSSVKEHLQKRFEPSCRKECHRAELQIVRKKKDEGWADVADKLREQAHMGYPDLEEKAKEHLALNH